MAVNKPNKPSKSRWSMDEVSILMKVWAEVHDTTGGSYSQQGRSLDEAIFSRYDERCVQSHLPRRSSNALSSQRDRMRRFARFVQSFNRQQAAVGRRPWFQLSSHEQRSANIPRDCRRQLSTFTDQTFKTLLCLLPEKDSRQFASTQHACESPVRTRQTCWTPDEEVRLARRWGRLVKRAGLTMEAFVKQPFEQTFKRFTPSGRSPVASSRKIRSLVNSYMFIRSFNGKHSPGWFELSESERDARSEDNKLPMDFKEITREVFNALEEIDGGLSGRVTTPAGQPMKEVLSPSTQSQVTVVLPPEVVTLPSLKDVAPLTPPPSNAAALVPKKEAPLLEMEPWGIKDEKLAAMFWGKSPPNELDQIMLENDSDDGMPLQSVVREEPASLTDGAPASDAGTLVDDQVLDEIELLGVVQPGGGSSQLQCKVEPLGLATGEFSTVEIALGQHDCELQSGLQQLQSVFELESLRNWACFRSVQTTARAVDGDASRKFALALEQQNQRVLSMMQRTQEVYEEVGAELRELICQYLGEEHAKLEPRRDEIATLPHINTLADLGDFSGGLCM